MAVTFSDVSVLSCFTTRIPFLIVSFLLRLPDINGVRESSAKSSSVKGSPFFLFLLQPRKNFVCIFFCQIDWNNLIRTCTTVQLSLNIFDASGINHISNYVFPFIVGIKCLISPESSKIRNDFIICSLELKMYIETLSRKKSEIHVQRIDL